MKKNLIPFILTLSACATIANAPKLLKYGKITHKMEPENVGKNIHLEEDFSRETITLTPVDRDTTRRRFFYMEEEEVKDYKVKFTPYMIYQPNENRYQYQFKVDYRGVDALEFKTLKIQCSNNIQIDINYDPSKGHSDISSGLVYESNDATITKNDVMTMSTCENGEFELLGSIPEIEGLFTLKETIRFSELIYLSNDLNLQNVAQIKNIRQKWFRKRKSAASRSIASEAPPVPSSSSQ